MRRIYFVRHAKSSWRDMSLSDIDRPLNGRGKRDAPLMADKLYQRVKNIELCIVSPARRAQLTAKEFIKKFDFEKVRTEDAVYHASSNSLLEVAHEIPNTYSSAIVFGHNPGYTYLHNYFAEDVLDNLPTCGIFELKSEADSWAAMDRDNTVVGFLLYPKMFIR